jgi:hypothetical protein
VLLVLAHLKPSLTDQDIPNHRQTDGLAPLIKAIRNCASSRVYKVNTIIGYICQSNLINVVLSRLEKWPRMHS